MNEISNQFIYDLFKDSWEWVSDKEIEASAYLTLEDIFNDKALTTCADKDCLVKCCRLLTEMLINQIEEPKSIENMKCQKEKIIQIASSLDLIKDKNLVNSL